MTVLSKPVPTHSYKSWAIIAGGHNRMIVQRRTEEGLQKNLTLAHRLTYGTTDLFKYRIIHTEDPKDFDGVYNDEKDLPPSEAPTPKIAALDKTLQPHQSSSHVVTTIYGTTISAETVNLGIVNAHRASTANAPSGIGAALVSNGGSSSSINNPLSAVKNAVAFGAPETATALFSSSEKSDRMVVAIANTEEEILADWEAIKDGWRMQGGGVIDIAHWESFYQGILRVAEEEANEEVLDRQQREEFGPRSNQQTSGRRGSVSNSQSPSGRSPNTFQPAIDHSGTSNHLQLSMSDRINLSATPQAGTTSPTLAASFGGWRMSGDRMPFRLDAAIDANAEAGSRSGCTSEELWAARVIQTCRWEDGYRSALFVCLFVHGWWYQWLNLMALVGTIAVAGIPLPKKIVKHIVRARRRSGVSPSSGRSPSTRSPAVTPRRSAVLGTAFGGRGVSPSDSQQADDEDNAAVVEESRASLIAHAAVLKSFMTRWELDTPQAIRKVVIYAIFANFISVAVFGSEQSIAAQIERHGGLVIALGLLSGMFYYQVLGASAKSRAAMRDAEAKKRSEVYKMVTQSSPPLRRGSNGSLGNNQFATASSLSRTSSISSQKPKGGLIFDGKKMLVDDEEQLPLPSQEEFLAPSPSVPTSVPPNTMPLAIERKPDIRTSILMANFEDYNARGWNLVNDRLGVKYFDRPSQHCNKNINKFTAVFDGANAATIDRCLNDDPRQVKGKAGGANSFKYDRLLTSSEGTGVIEDYSNTLGIHTCYKSPVFGIAARDVATRLVAGYYLTPKEQFAFRVGLGREVDDDGKPVATYPTGFIPNVWVMAALDNGNKQPGSYPAASGYQRAAVHRYLVLAEDLPPAPGSSVATSARFTLLINFDPQGSIPKSLLGATNEEQIDKVSFMRKLATDMGPIAKEAMAEGSNSPCAAEGSSHGAGPMNLDELFLPSSILTPQVLSRASPYLNIQSKEAVPISSAVPITKVSEAPPTIIQSTSQSNLKTPPPPTSPKAPTAEQLPLEIDSCVGFAHSIKDWKRITVGDSSKTGIDVYEAPSPPTCGGGKYLCHRFMLRVEGANAATVERLLQEDPTYSHKMGIGYAACHPLTVAREREATLQGSSEHSVIMRSVLDTGGTLSSKREVLTAETGAYYLSPQQQALSGFIVQPLAEVGDSPADRAARKSVLAACNVLVHAAIDAEDKVPPSKLAPATKGNVAAAMHRYFLLVIDDPNSVEQRKINTSQWPADERSSAFGIEVTAKRQTVATACDIVLMMDFEPRGVLTASAISAAVERMVAGLADLRKKMATPQWGPQVPMYESRGSARDGPHPVWSMRTGKQTAPSLHIDSLSGEGDEELVAAATNTHSVKATLESLILREIKTPFDIHISPDGTVTSTYPSLEGNADGSTAVPDLSPTSTSAVAANSLKEALSLAKNVFTNFHAIAGWQIALKKDGVVLLEATVPWCPKKAVKAHFFMPYVSCGMLDTVLSNPSQRYMQLYDSMLIERREVATTSSKSNEDSTTDNPFVAVEHSLYASPIPGVAGRDYVTKAAKRLYCTSDLPKKLLGVHQLLYNTSSSSSNSTSPTVGRVFIKASTDLNDFVEPSNGYQRGRLFYEFLVAQDVLDYQYSSEELDAFKGSTLSSPMRLAVESGVTTVPASLQSTVGASPHLPTSADSKKTVPNKTDLMFGTLVTLYTSADPLGKLPSRFGQLSNEATVAKLRHLYSLMLEQQAEDVTRLADRLALSRRR